MAIDLTRLKTYSVKRRKSKVALKDLAKVVRKDSFRDFYRSLPRFLAANGLREVVEAIRSARGKGKPILFFMGAHVIKCGLSPLVNELIRGGWITHIGANGACLVHDFEIAYAGKTSEDVAASLQDGSFGMAEETATYLNRCAKEAQGKKQGLGETFGLRVAKSTFPHRDMSIFAQCFRSGVTSSVHVAVGTDINHQHPSCDGAAWGDSSYRDFKVLVEQVMRLDSGGVVLNFGSNVMMPEVFLKALSVARNLSGRVRNFTTANFDMLFHYRPNVNIVQRPVLGGGRGHYIMGHHEIMLPLLATALLIGRQGD